MTGCREGVAFQHLKPRLDAVQLHRLKDHVSDHQRTEQDSHCIEHATLPARGARHRNTFRRQHTGPAAELSRSLVVAGVCPEPSALQNVLTAAHQGKVRMKNWQALLMAGLLTGAPVAAVQAAPQPDSAAARQEAERLNSLPPVA